MSIQETGQSTAGKYLDIAGQKVSGVCPHCGRDLCVVVQIRISTRAGNSVEHRLECPFCCRVISSRAARRGLNISPEGSRHESASL